MTYLRHATRHLRTTVNSHIVDWLNTCGWLVPPVTLSAEPVTVYLRRLKESELISISGNAVGLFWGPESDDTAEELGGGLMRTSHVLFADVIAAEEGIGLAITADIKDLLTAHPPGTSRFLPLRDYTAVPAGVPSAEYQIEIVEVRRERPENTEVKQFWQVLTVGVDLIFPGEDS